MDDYDPRSDPRPRRARRPENEADDAWSAADEDDLAEPDLEIEDLAAGYEWNNPDLLDEPPLRRRSDSRPYIAAEPVERPRAPLISGSYDPARGYPSGGPLSSEPPFDPFNPPTRPPDAPEPGPPLAPGCLSELPLWGIVVVVILALVALAVVIFACASVRLLLG